MKAANAIITAMSVFLISTPAFSAEVEWNYNGQATAKGLANPPLPAGCDSQAVNDTSFIASGNEISVVFTNMFVQLNAPSSPYQGSKNCHIVIPVRIAKGIYIGQLDQDLDYSILKDKNTTAVVASRASFYGYPVSSITVVEGKQTEDIGLPKTASAQPNDFAVLVPSWCGSHPALAGNLVVDVNTAASRPTNDQYFVSTFVPGYDARWTAIAAWYYCNL